MAKCWLFFDFLCHVLYAKTTPTIVAIVPGTPTLRAIISPASRLLVRGADQVTFECDWNSDAEDEGGVVEFDDGGVVGFDDGEVVGFDDVAG